MALTEKQKRFVDEYLIDLNATQAAIRAGYSAKTAQEIASQNLSKLIVQEYLKQRQEELKSQNEITRERVQLEIARLAFNDPRKVFDADGNLLPVKEWPDEVAACISSIKFYEKRFNDEDRTETALKEVKFWSKDKQLELAGKTIGIFTENINHKGSVTLNFDKLDSNA